MFITRQNDGIMPVTIKADTGFSVKEKQMSRHLLGERG